MSDAEAAPGWWACQGATTEGNHDRPRDHRPVPGPLGSKVRLKDRDPGWARTEELKELGKGEVKERARAILAKNTGPVTRLATEALWGLINLGEDAASVVFLNVPAGEIPAADYPPVCLQLGPGEGVRIPARILIGTDGFERDQPDVLLLIRLPWAGG
jgi:hypothetical protein